VEEPQAAVSRYVFSAMLAKRLYSMYEVSIGTCVMSMSLVARVPVCVCSCL
jgi:hypothetical protein